MSVIHVSINLSLNLSLRRIGAMNELVLQRRVLFLCLSSTLGTVKMLQCSTSRVVSGSKCDL